MNCYLMKWVCPKNIPIQVPCGKCLVCLTNKRNDWAFRLDQEYKVSQGAYFVTLTYHPKYCPDYGVSKRHLQLYLKRLRKSYGGKLRYYAVGEYGTRTNRPHYHLIIFQYDQNYLEGFLRTAWTTRKGESFGSVHIGNVNQASIMYCTKYVIQSGNHTNQFTNRPFMVCSRKYGLGLSYLTDKMGVWHRQGERNYTLVYGEKRRLPRYYKDKLWPNVNYGGWLKLRSTISENSKRQAIVSEQKNLQLLRDEGYSNPLEILTEMRNAVLSRVKQKVAFTQTI